MYPCPCCGYLTMEQPPPGSYDICPGCYWEDDPAQCADEEYAGGANAVCLREARENVARFGAVEPHFKDMVRPPLPSEIP